MATRPRAGRLLASDRFWELLGIVLVLAFWELYGRSVSPLLLPPLSRVLSELWITATSGRLLTAVFESLQLLLTGVSIATACGIVSGLALGRWPRANEVLKPYIQAAYASPRVAVVPLVIVWFGLGFWGKVILVFLASFFEVLIATEAGVRHVGAQYVEVARSFVLPERQLFSKIILPGAFPYIMSGVRLGVGHGLVGVVVAELFMQATGIGGLVVLAAGGFRTDRVLAALVLVSVAGIGISALLRTIERRAVPWKQETFE